MARELSDLLMQMDEVSVAQVTRYAKLLVEYQANPTTSCKFCRKEFRYVQVPKRAYCSHACACDAARRREIGRRTDDAKPCPVCKRRIVVLSDGSVAYHKKPGSDEWCPGGGPRVGGR